MTSSLKELIARLQRSLDSAVEDGEDDVRVKVTISAPSMSLSADIEQGVDVYTDDFGIIHLEGVLVEGEDLLLTAVGDDDEIN